MPDPILPEHELIRDAGSLPTLSSGLKHRVIVDCHVQIRRARWKTRAAYAGALMAACCLLLLVPVQPRAQLDPGSSAETETPDSSSAVEREYQSPGNYSSEGSRGSAIADEEQQKPPVDPAGRARQRSTAPQEAEQIHFLIEELRQREKKLCGFLPWI